jgi:hypothetical protein
MTREQEAIDRADAAGRRGPRCDHICLLPADHLDRGVLHQYGYELPSPRSSASAEEAIALIADGLGVRRGNAKTVLDALLLRWNEEA